MPDVRELAEAIRVAFDDLRVLPQPGEPGHEDTADAGTVLRAARRAAGSAAGSAGRRMGHLLTDAVKGVVTGAVQAAVSQATKPARKPRPATPAKAATRR
jgi:hypothetical protein